MSKLPGFRDRPLRDPSLYGSRAAAAVPVTVHQAIRKPCPRCGAAAGDMCIDPETDTESITTCYERRAIAIDPGNAIGPGRMVIYALSIWPELTISRRTLRALLPPGENRWGGGTARWNAHKKGNKPPIKNNVTDTFHKTLKSLEAAGLIQRGTDFVRIMDQRTLFDRAVCGLDNPQHTKFLHLEHAAEIVEKQIGAERDARMAEIRRRELDIIRHLIRNTPGRDSRRRNIRHEAGEIDIPLGETAARWNPTKNRRRP